jgi:hypothetical protein
LVPDEETARRYIDNDRVVVVVAPSVEQALHVVRRFTSAG